jgi:hypothetical protein
MNCQDFDNVCSEQHVRAFPYFVDFFVLLNRKQFFRSIDLKQNYKIVPSGYIVAAQPSVSSSTSTTGLVKRRSSSNFLPRRQRTLSLRRMHITIANLRQVAAWTAL